MHILHVTPYYYPAVQYGGPIQSVHLLNKYLVRKGHRVDVLTTTAGIDARQLARAVQQQELLREAERYRLDGVYVRYVACWGVEPYYFSPALARAMWTDMQDYDVVHITGLWNFPSTAAAWISRSKHRHYILSPRGMLYPEAIHLKSAWKKKLYYALIARHDLHRATLLHFTTAHEAEQSMAYLHLQTPYRVIPNGMETDVIRQALASAHTQPDGLPDAPYVLYLGRIHPMKGLPLLIEAFGRLVQGSRYPDLMLVIAGDDQHAYAAAIKQQVRDRGLQHRVWFVGQVSGTCKWQLYSRASLFVLPSLSENFGMAVVEAMACGCPVVVTEGVALSREIHAHSAGLVVSREAAALVEAMSRLLQDNALRGQLVAQAARLVDTSYRIEAVADAMIQAYAWMVGKD